MYRRSCKSNQLGQIFNIGGSNEVSNVKVAKELIRIMDMADREEALVTFVPDRPFNDLRYTIDCAKLHALGWKELVSFPEGLEHTVKVRFSVLLIVGVSISLPQSFIFLSLSIVADYSIHPSLFTYSGTKSIRRASETSKTRWWRIPGQDSRLRRLLTRLQGAGRVD